VLIDFSIIFCCCLVTCGISNSTRYASRWWNYKCCVICGWIFGGFICLIRIFYYDVRVLWDLLSSSTYIQLP
jgi:hypothetical protein